MKEKIISILGDAKEVERYASYCMRLLTEKKKDESLANPWMQKISAETLAEYYRRVEIEGLVFDGKHITLQSNGISFDYVAYKNKMLKVYPESLIDVALVYAGDTFSFAKESGKITYSHVVANPFNQEDKDIIGAYCVIINKRGEFLTTLSSADIEKHRKVAKTDYIWRSWYAEMVKKTIIKKAVKYFAEDFDRVEELDNEQYDLELPVTGELLWKQEVEAINTIEDLSEYYKVNKGRGKDFDKLVNMRKKYLTPPQNENI